MAESFTLLSLLEEKPGEFVSGEELSQKLNVSRTAIWKQIRKLETQGYKIEAVTRLGYRIVERPSRISPVELNLKLRTRSFGRNVRVHEVVASTQDEMRLLAEQGAPEGTLVIAEQQNQGRGRMGRHWVSPPGKGIWMSLLLRPNVPLLQTPQLTLLAAVALNRAIGRVTGLDIGIKWPNDLLIDGRKITGILLESATEDERIRYVVVGMGVSVNLEASDYPEEVAAKAISLRMASGRVLDRVELIAEILQEFEELYDVYNSQGFEPIRLLWEARSVNLHKPTVLTTASGQIEGIPRGISETGALLLETEDGRMQTVYSAEINPWEQKEQKQQS
ncbi:biotin--[acetyl-CoA-carboxylase] ligase [Cohnella sp. AR92]|uniref:biotin--[acetyl-CoA-carboxylase] ligase n=1 Tax=Cohnella sp. AR92 TaxID=648716 RepID=UPI000F8E9059|nr:biotin--[acetyl-CoA-carboxylase] ligase [Cohnella sp. AR92]RUS48207.1 biotin--[acetyl-CoA-carboxylase] ligase [Cohnella sp. AR92]